MRSDPTGRRPPRHRLGWPEYVLLLTMIWTFMALGLTFVALLSSIGLIAWALVGMAWCFWFWLAMQVLK